MTAATTVQEPNETKPPPRAMQLHPRLSSTGIWILDKLQKKKGGWSDESLAMHLGSAFESKPHLTLELEKLFEMKMVYRDEDNLLKLTVRGALFMEGAFGATPR